MSVDTGDEIDRALLDEISARLDLREPNVRAIESLAIELAEHEKDHANTPFEGVIDAATGVGKTYILADQATNWTAKRVSIKTT